MPDRALIWIVLAAAAAAAFAWHWRENRLLEQKLREAEIDALSRSRLMHFAWGRSSVFLLLLLGLICVFGIYDWRLRETEAEQAARPSPPAPTVAEAEPAPSPAPAQEPATAASPPPATAPEVQPSPWPDEPLTAAPPLPTIPGVVGELYAPGQHSQEMPAQLDQLKQRYEAMFVTHFYLLRCGEAQREEFHIINSGLMQELASYNAQSRLQYDILTAARGSYDEIYARTPCTPQNVGTLSANYKAYIQTLIRRSNMPPPAK